MAGGGKGAGAIGVKSADGWRKSSGATRSIRSRPTDRERLGDIAIEQGWFDLAIDAANSGAIWDRLDLRFPAVHWGEFQRIGATLQQLDANELIAIARRESGLYPLARSEVGSEGADAG